jgi:hypothetical protein
VSSELNNILVTCNLEGMVSHRNQVTDVFALVLHFNAENTVLPAVQCDAEWLLLALFCHSARRALPAGGAPGGAGWGQVVP